MLAHKYELNDYSTAPLYDERDEQRKKNKKRKELLRLKRQKMFFKLTCILFAASITLTSLFILRGYSSISEMRMNITKLERRRSELELTRDSISSELEEAKSSIKIREEAKYKLSMDYPIKDQVVYLSIGENKNTEKTKINDIVKDKDVAKKN